MLSDPQKRAAYDRFGHAGVDGMNGGGGQGFTDVHDIFNEVFGQAFGDMFGQGGRQPQAARRAARTCATTWRSRLEQAYAGADGRDRRSRRPDLRDLQGSGAKPGTSPTACATCGGAGRVRASQGFFSIERTCPRCGGAGPAGARSLPRLPRRRPGAPRAHAAGAHPAPASTTARASAWPARATPAPAADRAATSTSSSRSSRTSCSNATGWTCLQRAGADVHRRPGRRDRGALPARRRELRRRVQDQGQGARGRPDGRTVRLKGRGMPSLRSRERGDLVVELLVETPTRLTARQKELMRELAGICGEQQHPQSARLLHEGAPVLGRDHRRKGQDGLGSALGSDARQTSYDR